MTSRHSFASPADVGQRSQFAALRVVGSSTSGEHNSPFAVSFAAFSHQMTSEPRLEIRPICYVILTHVMCYLALTVCFLRTFCNVFVTLCRSVPVVREPEPSRGAPSNVTTDVATELTSKHDVQSDVK
ncbi:hypothetical protein BaRGS_00026406 [Batillaria attramentaria]|uniref:Transmembrane protein n=1 Tax=Batillaria attramentaria TaxID=370345 RepID=A0ABD0K6G1_9CAEN